MVPPGAGYFFDSNNSLMIDTRFMHATVMKRGGLRRYFA